MALIDELQKICERLAPLGWRDLLKKVTHNSLDIQQTSPAKLKAALTKPIANVDRTLPGFGDFDGNGKQGITPGKPSQSLLYHALASPCVTRDAASAPLGGFATPTEIETVENAVFGLQPPKLASLVQASGGKLVVAVFAHEYRQASDTVGRAHADIAFSRTGIARIGTARPKYRPQVRGFWPEDEDNANNFRVVPVRYSAWLAAAVRGNKAHVMRLDKTRQDDDARKFLIPVHKLFDGPECLEGLDLTLEGKAHFFNLKLFKVQKRLTPKAPVPEEYPYVITKGLAEVVEHGDFGRFAVVPKVQQALVARAMSGGKFATFAMPKGKADDFATFSERAEEIETPRGTSEVHRYPAYVHARTKVEDDQLFDLNEEINVLSAVKKGGYQALMYVDFTGEGWVDIKVPQLAKKAGVDPNSRPAFALLSAPDLFPSAGQRELSEWANSAEIPASFRGKIWAVPPEPLSETRLPANLQLPGSPFDPKDETMTAVVAMGAPAAMPTPLRQEDIVRVSCLPDDGAGEFAPGWDVAVDVLGPTKTGTPHLATYGLGSPFPEDAKLCAALSTFWPAVAPDVYRTMSIHTGNANLRGTVAPLTDQEIGQIGTLPWDGVSGPKIIEKGGEKFVEIADFLHVDYVRNFIENRFSNRLTARVTTEEYQRRALAAARVHFALGNGSPINKTRTKWLLLSFRAVESSDPEFIAAQMDAGEIFTGQIYRVEACFVGDGEDYTLSPRGPLFKLLPLRQHQAFFVTARNRLGFLRRSGDARWSPVVTE